MMMSAGCFLHWVSSQSLFMYYHPDNEDNRILGTMIILI